MAAITTAGSGNWTSTTVNAPWPSGTVPTSADDVTIASGHTVTLNATTCVANTVAVAGGGTLAASASANTKLTVQRNIDVQGNGAISADLSAAPTFACDIYVNNVRNTGNGEGQIKFSSDSVITLKGASRKRKTTLVSGISASATSATVTDATGWRVGDKIVFATTQAYNATPRVDEITLVTVNTGTGAITWTGGVTYAHATGGYVGNFSSNVTVRPATLGDVAQIYFSYGFASSFGLKTIQNVLLNGFTGDNFTTNGCFGIQANGVTAGVDLKTSFVDCAVYDWSGLALAIFSATSPIYVTRTIFYTSRNTTDRAYPLSAINSTSVATSLSVISDCGIFRNTGRSDANGLGGYNTTDVGVTVSDTFISACGGSGLEYNGANHTFTNLEIFSNNIGVANTSGSYAASNMNVGTFNSNACTNNSSDVEGVATIATISNSNTQTLSLTGLSSAGNPHSITYVNKNNDVTLQEIYRPFMQIKRDNSNFNRSTSSIAIYPTRINTSCQRTVSVPCANGSSIRVLGYVKRQVSGTQVASVALSGLGSAWGGFTAANNATWQVYDTGVVTNSTGNDGNFTLTYTASDTSSTSGVVYFDGVADAPFVTKARHYGYVFDEGNPNRVSNGTLTPIGTVSESTAFGYSDLAITGGASSSSIAFGLDRTMQQMYDRSQAWACQNLGFVPPNTGAGVFGSPSLFASGNVTTTGYTLNGGGSLSMGSYTLTASVPWVYTYTGGTFSQASTVPTFSGGTLAIGNGGTYTFTQAASMLLLVTSAGSASYTLSAGTFTGTLTVNNMNATPVTIFVPSGTTTSTTGNTGGTITFSAPIIQQSVTLTGVIAGSRVQIYDTTNSIELFNGTSGYSWTDSVAAVAPRAIRVRIARQSGATAYNFIEANVGTCGTTAPSNAVTYLASQTLDTVYNANAIDGSAVTGISIDDGIDRLIINIGGGSVSWPQIYAYNVYWLTTSAGIVDDGSIIVASDTANYRVSMFKIRNSSATPLSITGGYGVDASTGTVAPIIDVAGSTGNIYQTPEHVVAYQTTGTYAITGDISTVLTAVSAVPASVLSAAAAAPIASDIKKVNNVTINGNGVSPPFGP